MPMVTGIGMGEIRTALDIKKNEGLVRKCCWGTFNCADSLEGKTIQPENLFEINEFKKPFPIAFLDSGLSALFVMIFSFLFYKKRKKKIPTLIARLVLLSFDRLGRCIRKYS